MNVKISMAGDRFLYVCCLFYRMSVSLFRHIDRMDISSFQNANLGVVTDFSLTTLFPFAVSI